MSIRPLNDQVLLKHIEAEDTFYGTDGKKTNIIIADKEKYRPNKGIVIEVGPGRYFGDVFVPVTGIKEGDQVLFEKHVGAEVELGDGEGGVRKGLKLVPFEAIRCVFQDDGNTYPQHFPKTEAPDALAEPPKPETVSMQTIMYVCWNKDCKDNGKTQPRMIPMQQHPQPGDFDCETCGQALRVRPKQS